MLMLLQRLLVPAFCAEGRAPTAGPPRHLQGHTVTGAGSSGLGPAHPCSCDSSQPRCAGKSCFGSQSYRLTTPSQGVEPTPHPCPAVCSSCPQD